MDDSSCINIRQYNEVLLDITFANYATKFHFLATKRMRLRII